MYEEYLKAYRHHSATYGAETAIFYLVGKFYELYDCAADPQTPIRRITDLLDIQLSIKKGDHPSGADGLFAGVPEQSLHKYAARLTGGGWTVVVYDQIKDTRGNVSARTVARILTPGTHIEATAGDATACILAGIWLEPATWGSAAAATAPAFGLVALDLTTGAITTYESTSVGKPDSWTADDAFHFFQVHAPREAILFWRGQQLDTPSEELVRRQFGLLSAKLRIVAANPSAQGGFEIPQVREDLLRRSITIKGLLPLRQALNIQTQPRVERALCALLHQVEQLYPSVSTRLHCPEVWSPASNLYLGNHALIQLNMITPRIEDSVLGLFTKSKTPMGQRAIRRRVLHPIADTRRLARLYDELDCFGTLEPKALAAVERALSHIEDLPRLHRRILLSQVTATTVLDLDKSYESASQLRALLKDTPLAAPPELDIAAIRQAFTAAFHIDKAKTASEDQSFLQDDAAPDVALQEKTIAETYKAMTLAVEQLGAWAGLPPASLRLEFRETMGPVVQGPKAIVKITAERLRAPSTTPPFQGIRLQEKKSGAGFEIPHLDSLFRSILGTRHELATAVRTALPGLCDTCTESCLVGWDLLEEWISAVDVSLTLWRTGQDLGFVRPMLVPGDAAAVSIEGLRHPLIEATASKLEYVRHTVKLGGTAPATGWLVYGMNASGKSSLMKAVGIAVLLAQAGCYVPASQMTLTPFRGLYTRILNTDNLWAGLSSFAVEMTELREILARADHHSLVLGDELCSGTESVSATALVGAGIQWLHNRNARFIFATHLHGLMEIPEVAKLSRLKTWHLKVHYDVAADRLVYDRTLTPGPGSSLYGLEVARAMNIPDDILTTAHQIRRKLLGTAAESEAPMSAWNPTVQRRACEKCGAAIVRELEVHHLQPRATANAAGRLPDGTHQNHIRNLVVLCAKCHDAEHAEGAAPLTPLRLTSDGPIRLPTSPPDSPRTVATEQTTTTGLRTSSTKSKWTSEQMLIIEAALRKFPTLPPKRIAFDLEREHGIQISVASLRTIRGRL
jgi:DNA mismatch repair protein MutS